MNSTFMQETKRLKVTLLSITETKWIHTHIVLYNFLINDCDYVILYLNRGGNIHKAEQK